MGLSTVFNTTNRPVDLHDGRVIGAHEEATSVDLSVEHNQQLVDDGHLAVREERKASRTAATSEEID